MSKQAQLQAEFDDRKAAIESRYARLRKAAFDAQQKVIEDIDKEMSEELAALDNEYWTPKQRVEEVGTASPSPPGMSVE